ncbi:MAG: sigma-70 family RNA polymerase sigma factor [Planctomycetota bacterium]|nr:MAG: sigma-70 family RNA polymerase sigma factor [Planctomycetota bacterium]
MFVNNENPPNVESSEVRLLERAANGDRDARRELFERYREIAYRVARRITGRHADALDVVQDAFIRAFEKLDRFQRDAKFKTWLLRIVSNRALDVLRSRKVRLAMPLDHGSGDDDAPGFSLPDPDAAEPTAGIEQAELAVRLRQAIESLPLEQRTVFSMYASGDLTYGEIAEALGIPIGTVMSRLYHARRRLHEQLSDLAPQTNKAADDE